VKAEVPEMRPEQTAADPSAIARKKRAVLVMAGLAAVLVLGGVAFFAYKSFLAPQPPPPPVVKAPAPAPAATKAPVVAAAPPVAQPASPAPATPAAGAPASLSNTLNTIAHVPAKAIGKAQDAIEARRASGQTRVDPALGGKELADKPAVAPPSGSATPAAKPKTASARTAISKGVSATTELEMASGDASAEFRSFVANAKISGVFQGTPARVMINGRLVRTGETVEANLGIIFEGVDSAKRHLLFKDRSGAVVTHKY
jgi:hypothetical protein